MIYIRNYSLFLSKNFSSLNNAKGVVMTKVIVIGLLMFFLTKAALAVFPRCAEQWIALGKKRRALQRNLSLLFCHLLDGDKVGKGKVIGRRIRLVGSQELPIEIQPWVMQELNFFGRAQKVEYNPTDFSHSFDLLAQGGEVELRIIRTCISGYDAALEILWLTFPQNASFVEEVAPSLFPLLFGFTEFENIPFTGAYFRERFGEVNLLAINYFKPKDTLQICISAYSHIQMKRLMEKEQDKGK